MARFHEWTLRGFRQSIPFVGLQNYRDLFSNPDLINSLRITATFVILAVCIEFVLGMGLALLLNHDLRNKNIIRGLILLPMMCTNVVIGLTWRLLLNYEFGMVNYYLGVIGVGPCEWLSKPEVAFSAVILVDVWNTTSFVALLLLAGLRPFSDAMHRCVREASCFMGVIIAKFCVLYRALILLLFCFLLDLRPGILEVHRQVEDRFPGR